MKVFYNGVWLSRVFTERWDETVKYDDTGVNVLGSTITMSFRASVLRDNPDGSVPLVSPWPYAIPNPNVVQTGARGINSGVGGDISTDTSDKLKKMLRDLQIPRCALFVYDDITGKPVFEAYPAPLPGEDPYAGREDRKRNIDVNNGPKPLNVHINTIVNEYYEITFEIEVTKIRCLEGETHKDGAVWDSSDPSKGIVVSNRCWTEETIDDNFYLTRTFSGKLTISTNSVSVHSYRHLFYPPLEVGFRRSSVRFSESQDGLSLNYVVTDKQIRNSAPYPITQFAGNVTYSLLNSYKEVVDLQLSVMGAPFSPRKVLFSIARVAIYNKLKSFQKAVGTQVGNETYYGYNVPMVTKFEVSENMGDPPSITIRVNALLYVNPKGPQKTTTTTAISGQNNELTLEETKDNSFIATTFLSGGLKTIGAEAVIGEEISNTFASVDSNPPKPLIVTDAYHQWTYNRKLSSNPNPYGYNIYQVFDDDDKEIENDSESSTFLFIKTLATTPCAAPPSHLDPNEDPPQQNDNNKGLVIAKDGPKDSPGVTPPEKSSSDYDTTVTKEPYTKIQQQPETSLTTQTLECPYTHYKSHVIYSTVYNRIVKPKFFTAFNSDSFSEPVIVDVAPAEGRYFVTIEAEKLNGLPDLPDPEEILTVTHDGETTGGIENKEEGKRDVYSSGPEYDKEATTNTTIDNWIANKYCRTLKPTKFYCLKNSVQITEPQTTTSGNGILYSVLATYEYAMSRPLRKGDEVRLLLNPIVTQDSCYYSRTEKDGEYVANRANNLTIYDGTQLNHMPLNEASGVITETTNSEPENTNP